MNTVMETYSKKNIYYILTGCGFDSRCSTRKRGLVPTENYLFLEIYQDSRVWSKGADLRSVADASWVQIPPLVYILSKM